MKFRSKKMAYKFLAVSVIGLVFLGLFEVVLRLKGATPFSPTVHNVIYKPDFIFAPNMTLGYTLKSGNFEFIMCDLDSLRFNPTHNRDSCRITRSPTAPSYAETDPVVIIFGGSFTYGVGVEDSSTFVWMLQQRFPGLNIKNYAVPGYAPVHAYIRLHSLIAQNKAPTVAILNYSYTHDDTNTLPRRTRASIVKFNNLDNFGFIHNSKVPFGMLIDDSLVIRHISYDSFYSEWPLKRYSSLIHFLDTRYNELEERFYHSHEVSKAIILKIADLCEKNDITFVLSGISQHELTSDMLAFCETRGILNTDISVGLPQDEKYRIHEKDGHPNTRAHKEYADALYNYLIMIPVFRESTDSTTSSIRDSGQHIYF